MPENSLTVRTRIEEIHIIEKGGLNDDRKGYIDVRYWLEREGEVLSFATIRLFFKRTNLSLDALTSAALTKAHQVCSQIAQHYKPTPSHTNAEQLWKE